MKEQRRVTQVAIDDIVENSRSIFQQTMQRVEAAVKAKVAESGYHPDSIDGLDAIIHDIADPFKGIETCHLQEKYYHETLGLIVSIKCACAVSTPQNIRCV